MMSYGFAGGAYLLFGWLISLLVLVALGLSIAALWKYLKK